MRRVSRFLRSYMLPALLLITGHLSSAAAADPDTLTLSLNVFASGYSNPIFITHAPGDSTRLFVVERSGRIMIIRNGSQVTRPFLNITSRVLTGGERGLLGMAFHPNFPDSNYLYVNYVGDSLFNDYTRISRFTVSSDPDSAIAASELVLIAIYQPQTNHNGGMIAFGPDSMLYIGMGDGGGGGDPLEDAQDPQEMLGKMLRLDVDNAPTYIPADNPFVGNPSVLDQIWAIGVRNPFRWSFDRLTGDMWIADVGQNAYEEIDFEAASVTGGLNYGWDNLEGFHCYEPSSNCDSVGMTFPIYEYTHNSNRCSITGGYNYRGCAIPDLDGWYLYGDYCTGEVWRLKRNPDNSVIGPTRLFDLSNFNLVSFGEDYYGELYVAELNSGNIRKLVHDGAVADYCTIDTTQPCCQGPTGNVNDDPQGNVTLTDLTVLVNFLFVTFEPLACPAEANMSGDAECDLNLTDLTRLVNFLFVTFEPVAECGDFDSSLCQ